MNYSFSERREGVKGRREMCHLLGLTWERGKGRGKKSLISSYTEGTEGERGRIFICFAR